MKAEELKLGDWISYEDEPIQIEDLFREFCCGTDKQGYWHDKLVIDDIEPIPLTEEILEKNGWKIQKKENEWYNEKNSILIRKLYSEFICYLRGNVLKNDNDDAEDDDEDYDNTKDILLNEVNYVHRLQHILWALDMDDNLKV